METTNTETNTAETLQLELTNARKAFDAHIATKGIGGPRLCTRFANEADSAECSRLAAEITRIERALFDDADASFPIFDEEV